MTVRPTRASAARSAAGTALNAAVAQALEQNCWLASARRTDRPLDPDAPPQPAATYPPETDSAHGVRLNVH